MSLNLFRSLLGKLVFSKPGKEDVRPADPQLLLSVQSYIDEKYACSNKRLQASSVRSSASCEGMRSSASSVSCQCLDIWEEDEKADRRAELPELLQSDRRLEDLVAQTTETFQQALFRMIDERGLKDSEVYKRANMDKELFSKIRSNADYQPKIITAISLALALRLNLDETRDFIGRAGFALTHTSKFDIIIEYFIENKNYDLFEINQVLFAFGEPLIGNF
ncbi:MAG: hypothetical protein IKW01_02600 [Firmicutes bacterium]|nr:hypothetical protein [Bacillota bacterium]